MGRPKLDISDEERYERHKQCCLNYKKKRMETDPEYKEKVREYNTNYFKNMIKNGKAAKEIRLKQEQETKEENIKEQLEKEKAKLLKIETLEKTIIESIKALNALKI